MGWDTSCGVDAGALSRSGADYVFRTSKNKCTGGIYLQRSEIFSDNIRIDSPATYLFETTMSFRASQPEDAVVFQIHDGRNGCAPPMSLRWRGNGELSFDSDYTRDQGMQGCTPNQQMRSARFTGPRLVRDGRAYAMRVFLTFDGQGGFAVQVAADGRAVLQGAYVPPADPAFVRSSRFYMKHGVYSQRMFDYEMRSSGMRVLRQK
ncbi:hypothetical protein [Anianabacter salinae]|uniref:hypothetical protein n=1 Tax=Anianabacter salinae TaxID=2851023 RepID=UPI00225DE80D|nr:hypothetical protein [Anianabacter salinae]